MANKVFISGLGCLSPYGLRLADLVQGYGRRSALSCTTPLGRHARPTACGCLPDFKEALTPYAKPLLRRKMSRLSKMAVTAAGDALAQSGLLGQDNQQCGVLLGTAFGSTAQSDLFYTDLLDKGALKVNPGYFPETVPNAPAGQVSIIFGLQGPNSTVCQQGLSSEHALALALDLITCGMAQRMLVVGVEEMSPALLGGLQACGQLHNGQAASADKITLGERLQVGEAAVALVLESEASLSARNSTPLAQLTQVVTGGGASWPAVYHDIAEAIGQTLAGLSADLGQPDAVVAGSSYIRGVDHAHFQALARHLDPQLPCLLPEYGTGNVMGAGLLRTALAVALLGGESFACRDVAAPLLDHLAYDQLYDEHTRNVRQVLVSAVSAGGGAAALHVAKV